MGIIIAAKNKSRPILKIDGPATIEHVGDLKQELVKQLAKRESMEIDLTGVTSADIAFLQLLESFCKTSLEKGKTIHVAGDSPILKELSGKTGFFRQNRCVFFPEKPCILHNRGSLYEGAGP